MRKAKSLFTIIAIYTLGCSITSASGPAWIRDLPQAQKAAQSDDKPLFILFTGLGWCHACEVLDREVFQTETFVDATRSKYVFVELDYYFREGPEEEQRKSELKRLQERYLTPAVPTVVLTDARGCPYAYLTGYDLGSGPQAYLELLGKADKAREKRDGLLSSANSESGTSRAKLLDHALECVAPLLGEIGDRGDDPVLLFYSDTVREILELTGHEGDLAEKYVARQTRRNEWLASEAVFGRLEDFDSTKDYAGAINYIEVCLKSTTSESMRWRLEFARQVYLEWSHRYAEALKNCRRLLAVDEVPEQYREPLLDREVYNLFQLNRIDEGLAHYDRRIADPAHDPEQRKQLLRSKAGMMLGRDPVSQSIATWMAFRKETKWGTEDWLDASALLSRELRRAKRHEEALRMIEEFLSEERLTWQLLDAAESCLALGKTDRARNYIDEAESANRGLADSQRQAEREQFDRVAARIVKLTQQLAKDSAAASTKTKP